MTMRNKLTVAVLVAAFGALMAPAFAQNGSSGMPSQPDHGMSMGDMSQGMMSGGMMGRGMMSGRMMAGCAEMMQSMNNGGNGTPNSRWQKHLPRNPNDGG